MTNTVAVIGSGPDYHSIKADVGYFANYSILRPECAATPYNFTRKVVAISEAALFPEIFQRDAARINKIVEQRDRLLQAHFDGMQIFSSYRRRIGEVEISLPVIAEFVDLKEQQRMLRTFARTSLPVWDCAIFSRLLQLQQPVRSRLLRNFLKSKGQQLVGRFVSAMGPFRPSAGVNTLLRALAVHGTTTSYHVTGIQFGAREKHAIFEGPFVKRFASESSLPQHEVADQIIVRRLLSSGAYRINFFAEYSQ